MCSSDLVPQEQCLRPYGVLPTDVRDFGIIAPCPGQGAVRCISVNDAQLLEFQAAVAAVEASQARFTAAAAAVSEVEAEENVNVSFHESHILSLEVILEIFVCPIIRVHFSGCPSSTTGYRPYREETCSGCRSRRSHRSDQHRIDKQWRPENRQRARVQHC